MIDLSTYIYMDASMLEILNQQNASNKENTILAL